MAERDEQSQTPSDSLKEQKVGDSNQNDSKDLERVETPSLGAPGKHVDEQEDQYPPFTKVLLIMSSLYLAMFLAALVGALARQVGVW